MTPRQKEILTLVSEGMTNKEIGTALGISDQTVKNTLATMFKRYGAGTRTELLRLAMDMQEREYLQQIADYSKPYPCVVIPVPVRDVSARRF